MQADSQILRPPFAIRIQRSRASPALHTDGGRGMSPVVVAQTPASALVFSFDRMAKDYDDVFTRSMIGRAQRGAVWNVLKRSISKEGDTFRTQLRHWRRRALSLTSTDISVLACDASPGMIRTARHAAC